MTSRQSPQQPDAAPAADAASSAPAGSVAADPRSLNRQILALAVPAFGALIAEPLFVLADTSIVGHLGTPQLAGLAAASQVVTTVASAIRAPRHAWAAAST